MRIAGEKISHSLPQLEFDLHWNGLTNEGDNIWVSLEVLLLVLELKVEELRHVREENLHVHLSEDLANADSLSTGKCIEAEWVSLLAIWGQVEWALGVPSVWQVLEWTLPLRGVMMESLVHDESEFVSLLELVVADFHVLKELDVRGS